MLPVMLFYIQKTYPENQKERDNMSELLETNYPASSLGPGMKYIKLGRSGLEVSQICCGTMGFGDLNRILSYPIWVTFRLLSTCTVMLTGCCTPSAVL